MIKINNINCLKIIDEKQKGTSHIAGITNLFLAKNNVSMLSCTFSQGMNPIEQAWDILGRAVKM